ncbi:MAG: hypothetical protein V4537_07075 [Pseudomonadota bacterium]
MTTTTATTGDFEKTLNYLLDNILGLDGTNKLAHVAVTRKDAPDANGYTGIKVEIRAVLGPWTTQLVTLVGFDIDPEKDRGITTLQIQKKIADSVAGYVNSYVDQLLPEIDGVDRGIAMASSGALKALLANRLLKPIAAELEQGILDLSLPDFDAITGISGDAFKNLLGGYFEELLPGIAKSYAKLGLAEILATVTADSSPSWATAIRSVGDKVLEPVLDNLIQRYFTGDTGIALLDADKFRSAFNEIVADLLVDFDHWNEEIFDDLLGLDGENWFERVLADFGSEQLRNVVELGVGEVYDFFAGKITVADLQKFFGEFDAASTLGTLSTLFANYAGTQLAYLFVTIDSLPESLVSKLGAYLGSELLGDALGALTGDVLGGLVALFGNSTATAVGATIFQGFGAVLGAGIGAIAGSVLFELIDGLFDGAISDAFNDFVSWIRNDSPQAFYQALFDPAQDEYHGTYEYSKDSNAQMRAAVKAMRDAFEDKVNLVLNFVGEDATVAPAYGAVMFVWGKKHFDEKYAYYIANAESQRYLSSDPVSVVTNAVGATLRNIDFHNGNAIIAKAYDQWKAELTAAGATNAQFMSNDAFVAMQAIIGLARFANAYRQDPTVFDALMASDNPIGITILQQFLDAQVRGFNDPVTLRGSQLNLAEIGSAAAGDTIYLDGPAWKATARGGDDTIHIGTAMRQEIDGGTGTDTVVLTKARAAYGISAVDAATRHLVLTDTATGVTIVLTEVEVIRFTDTTWIYDDVFGNRRPVIQSNGAGPVGSVTTNEGGAFVMTIVATDAEGDALSYAIVGGPDAALFRIDRLTGALSFLTTPDHEAPEDADLRNTYELVIEVRDAKGSDTQALTVVVRDVNEGLGEGSTAYLSDFNDVWASGGTLDEGAYGSFGNDTLTGGSGANLLVGEGGNDILSGLAGHDRLYGGIGNDALYGGEGNDLLDGGTGDDVMTGDGGDDLIRGGAGDDRGYGGDADDRLFGGAGNDILGGDAGADWIEGEAGDDALYGGTGIDVLIGGSGRDILTGDAGDDRLAGDGDDDTLWGGDGRDVLDGGAGDDLLQGDAGDDRIAGGAGNDQLTGGAGVDELLGGDGDDLITGELTDTIDGGAGRDTLILSLIDAAAGANFGTWTLLGTSGAIRNLEAISTIIGSRFDDRITVGNQDAVITIYGNDGDDTVSGNDSRILFFGGAGDDRFIWTPGAHYFQGDAGNDTIDYRYATGGIVATLGSTIEHADGSAAADTLIGNGLDNKLQGFGGNDVLHGLAGNDTLIGGAGSDTLHGGAGDDIYIVDSDDSVVEIAGQGFDRVLVIASFTLGTAADVEALSALDRGATTAIDIIGNAVAQVIHGNEGRNQLDGLGGDDTLYGLGGGDFLDGGDGNDVLDGGSGGDWMRGGRGDDWFVVDASNDVVVEAVGGGSDRVLAYASYRLTADAEIELVTAALQNGGDAMDLAGNGFAQSVIGNEGANRLEGLGGNDTLYGLGGNDVLDGGAGSDTLIGGAGADDYRFTTAPGADNIDTIIGFEAGVDRILLDRGIFVARSTGALLAGAFATGSAAQETDDRIIYDPTNGMIWYDADGSGSGAAIAFARVAAGTALTAAAFEVI